MDIKRIKQTSNENDISTLSAIVSVTDNVKLSLMKHAHGPHVRNRLLQNLFNKIKLFPLYSKFLHTLLHGNEKRYLDLYS